MEHVKQIVNTPILKKIFSILSNFTFEYSVEFMLNIVIAIVLIETIAITIYSILKLTERKNDFIHYATSALMALSSILTTFIVLNRSSNPSILLILKIVMLKIITSLLSHLATNLCILINALFIKIKYMERHDNYIAIEYTYTLFICSVIFIIIVKTSLNIIGFSL